MKKYKITVLVCLILVVSLLITLVVVTSIDKEDTTLPTWQEKSPDYAIGTARVGTIEKTVGSEGKAGVDRAYFDVYTFADKSAEDLLVKRGDIVLPEALFFKDESVANKNLGRVEDIVANGNTVQVTVSNFEHLQCRTRVPQINAVDIAVGQEAKIKFNDRTFSGFVKEKDYIMSDDGFLNIIVAIEQTDRIIVNASVTVDIILLRKKDVLTVPSEALIAERNGYYVNVLTSDDKIERKEVAVGIIGDRSVEIKSGLSDGEKVLIGQYE